MLLYTGWLEKSECALLAQLDRVTGYEPVGQGFESLAARQKETMHRVCMVFLFLFLNCYKSIRKSIIFLLLLFPQSCGIIGQTE